MNEPRILVATDFSEMSRYALDYATAHAKITEATLLVVHVLPVPVSEQGEGMLHRGVHAEDRQTVERRLKSIKPGTDGVRFEHRLVEGEPARAILSLASRENVGMIVMGTHGRTGVMRTLMGSVAEEVVRNAPCPVVTVKVPNRKP